MRTDVDEIHTLTNRVKTPSGTSAHLFSADEVRALPPGENQTLLTEIVDWCENFLGRPSALVGRTGNVCPFVPQAMVLGSLKFAVFSLRERGMAAVGEIEEIINTCREHFVAQEKARGKIDIFGSMVMIFPEVSKEEASEVIDPLQRKLKPTFVKEGLMLGEFHPLSPTPGLRNRAFRPLRSPIPLLAIRHMVESDVDFLMAPFDPAPTRVQSLKAYLQFLGPSLSVGSQVKAKESLKVAEVESGIA
jgi:hypothetical protein